MISTVVAAFPKSSAAEGGIVVDEDVLDLAQDQQDQIEEESASILVPSDPTKVYEADAESNIGNSEQSIGKKHKRRVRSLYTNTYELLGDEQA